jgi:hypothetical protein
MFRSDQYHPIYCSYLDDGVDSQTEDFQLYTNSGTSSWVINLHIRALFQLHT